MTLKITQGLRNCRHSIGDISLPISGLQKRTTILHRFGYVRPSTLSVYVTVCDLETSFSFEHTVEITSQVNELRLV